MEPGFALSDSYLSETYFKYIHINEVCFYVLNHILVIIMHLCSYLSDTYLSDMHLSDTLFLVMCVILILT